MENIKNRRKYIFLFLVGILTGILLGILIFNILISYRIEQYHREIEYLNSIIEEQEVRLENFEDKLHKKKLILKKVELDTKFKDEKENEIVSIELEKYIKEKYNNVIGKEIDKLDADILMSVIDNRIMKINEKEYKIKVKKLILSENLKIYILVECLKK